MTPALDQYLNEDPILKRMVDQELEGKDQQLEEKDQQIALLIEELRHLKAFVFGRKTEKTPQPDNGLQPLLPFPQEDAAPQILVQEQEKTIEIKAHSRKRGRKPLPADLPVQEVVVDIPEADKTCSCGCQKARIGEETADKLEFTPARAHITRIVRPKYACRNCEGTESDEPTVSIAPVPEQIIPKSFATASLLAYIITSKFVDALPFHRLSGMFSRQKIEISRGTMCNWAVKVARVLKPIDELFKEMLMTSVCINTDESPMQVLKEPGRKAADKSWIWVFRGGGAGKATVYFHYSPSRGGKVADEILENYQGYIQTDGYSGYNFISSRPGQKHLACWAHARRKFFDSIKAAGEQVKPGIAHEAFAIINSLYKIEKEARINGLSTDEIQKIREQRAKPILETFKTKLETWKKTVVPKSLTGKAVTYTLNFWDKLMVYIENGELQIDNNSAENAIRPFAVGRKNWLFADTVEGAAASAILYSIIETAKANSLEPYWYLRFLLEKAPGLKSKEEFRSLIPQNVDRQLIMNMQQSHVNAGITPA